MGCERAPREQPSNSPTPESACVCCIEATEKGGERGRETLPQGRGRETEMRKAVEQEQVDAVRGQSWVRDGRQREMAVKGRWRGESPTPRREEQRRRCWEGRGQDWGVVK